jgi:hypothetical protein
MDAQFFFKPADHVIGYGIDRFLDKIRTAIMPLTKPSIRFKPISPSRDFTDENHIID